MEIGELLEENTDTINEKDLNSKEEVLMDTKDSFSNGLFLTKNDIDPYDSFSLLKKKEVKILKEFFIHHYDDLERFTFSEFKTLLDENGLSKLLTNTKFIKIANLFLEDIDDEQAIAEIIATLNNQGKEDSPQTDDEYRKQEFDVLTFKQLYFNFFAFLC